MRLGYWTTSIRASDVIALSIIRLVDAYVALMNLKTDQFGIGLEIRPALRGILCNLVSYLHFIMFRMANKFVQAAISAYSLTDKLSELN